MLSGLESKYVFTTFLEFEVAQQQCWKVADFGFRLKSMVE